MALSVFGILAAFVLMNLLVYKGLDATITSFICCFVIIFTSGLNFNEAMAAGLGTVGSMCSVFIGIYVFGGVLASIYQATNATASLGKLILKPFGKCENPKVRRIGTLSMLVLVRVILGLAGLDNLAIMPLMVALVVAVFSGCDLPRKYVNCTLMFAATVGVMIPGAPHQYVVILQSVLTDYNNSGNLLVRWLLLLIYIAAGILILDRMMEKDQKKGLHFDPGPLEVPDLNGELKAPHWLLTFIPMIVVYLTYNFLHLETWVALVCGVVVATALYFPYLPKEEGKTRLSAMVGSFNKGAVLVPLGIAGIFMVSSVMALSDGFNWLVDLFCQIPIPAAFGLMLIAILLTGATGAAQSALIIVGGIAAANFLPAGLSVQAAGLIALWATTVLDSLPNNLGIILQCDLTKCSMKECYPSIFKTTVVLTLVMCLLVCLFAVAGLYN